MSLWDIGYRLGRARLFWDWFEALAPLAAIGVVLVFVGLFVWLIVWGLGLNSDGVPVVREGPGEERAAIDGNNHCRVTAWAAASGGGGDDFTVELDSGAGASLWLTYADAARIGFGAGSLWFTSRYSGISDSGWAASVLVPQFRIGGATFSNVPALVVTRSAALDVSLIGLPILTRLHYRVDGDSNSCVISW
jgi:Aspartyl protease